MPSATQQARMLRPMVSAQPTSMERMNATAAWLASLPSSVRTTLQARLTAIVQALPPVSQLAYLRYMAKAGHANPVPLPTQDLAGFGAYGRGQWGLGQFEALISALPVLVSAGAQAGTSLYEAKQSNDLQAELASNALASQDQIAAANLAAGQQAQAALLSAQQDAAKIAGGAEVQVAQIQAGTQPQRTTEYMWIGGGVIAVALLGIVALKSRSSSPRPSAPSAPAA
jgi:hypothetical protein